MRNRLIVASALLTFAAPLAAAAADNTATGIGVYRSFFAQSAPKPNQNPPINRNQSAPTSPAKPTVVCGMTLLPTRPVDPGMKIATPDAKRFPMRTLEPQICKR